MNTACFPTTWSRACSTWLNLPEVAWSEVVQSESEYDFGKAKYCFIELQALEEHVPAPKLEDYSVPGATKMIMEYERVIEAPMDLVFDVISDMEFRHDFMPNLVGSDMFNHKITQTGSTHRCVIKRDESDPFFIAHNFAFDQNKVTFVESNHKDKFANIFTLVAIGKGLTRFKISTFAKPHLIKELLFRLLMKKKSLQSCEASFSNFNDYCKKLHAEGQEHSNRIVLPQEVALAA